MMHHIYNILHKYHIIMLKIVRLTTQFPNVFMTISTDVIDVFLECSETRNQIPTYTTGTTTTKPTYANLKAESLQSDENQVSLNEDIMVSNVVTVLYL